MRKYDYSKRAGYKMLEIVNARIQSHKGRIQLSQVTIFIHLLDKLDKQG